MSGSLPARLRVCNNCSQAYSPRRRKCPTIGCRAPKRFSVEETDAQLAARQATQAEQLQLIETLAAGYEARR